MVEEDQTVKLWDATSGQEMLTLVKPSAKLSANAP